MNLGNHWLRRVTLAGLSLSLLWPLVQGGAMAQDPAVDKASAVDKAPAAAPEASLDDLPEDFPLPDGTAFESGEKRGHHRTLKLSIEGTSFDDLFRHFSRQLPEKNFRILNQTQDLPLAGFDRASSFTVRARNGAVFGLLIMESKGHLHCVLEGRF